MRKSLVLLLALVPLLAACAMKSGRDFNVDDVHTIERGKTTKEEIVSKFGKPQYVAQSSQGETWYFMYTDNGYGTPIGIFGMKGTTKNLAVTFDGNVVKDFNWTTAERDKPTGTYGF